MSYPNPSKVTVGPDRVVKVTISRPRSPYSRAGIQNLSAGTREVSVTFTTPTVDANWVLGALTIVNSADSAIDVQAITAVGRTAPSQSGFSVILSAAPLSANYKLHWSIMEAYNP